MEGQPDNPPDPITAALAAMQQSFLESTRKANEDMLALFRREFEARHHNRNGDGDGGENGNVNQAGGVADTGRVLLNFKKHDPPNFYGEYEPIAAAKWLQDLDKIFTVMECPDRQKLLFATYLLKGDAHEWW